MIRLIQRRLIVPRGDTGTFSIPVLAGKDTGDVSIFTVFDPLMHRKIFEKVMTLSGETLTMELTHGDTVNLPVGQYVWDIKFYTDPIFVEEKLIGGTEVDSYYAAFTLPVCEIRETGDNLLMSDNAPTGALKPGQIDFVTASINEMTSLKNTTTIRAAEADTSAQNAANSAQDALVSQQAAQTAASNAEASAELAAQKAAEIAADLSGKADKSEIPTKVSELENDAGYITGYTETDPTVPAWAKAAAKPSYTATEVGAPTVQEMNSAISTAIGNVNSFDMAVVQTLPTQDINTHTIYLVPKTGETNDVYDEYVYINNAWEMIGNTQIDLSNYATKNEVTALIDDTASVGDTDVTFSADKLTAMDSALKNAIERKFGVSNLKANGGLQVEVDTETGKNYLITEVYGDTIAPNYFDLTFPVRQGQYCLFNRNLWIANTEIASQEYFNRNHWTQVDVGTSLDAKEDKPDLVVTFLSITPDAGNVATGTVTADKTPDEVLAAYTAGKTIKAISTISGPPMECDLQIAYETFASFECPVGRSMYYQVSGNPGGNWTYQLRNSLIGDTQSYWVWYHRLTNVTDPVDAQDAATKNYVDTHAVTVPDLEIVFSVETNAETGGVLFIVNKTWEEFLAAYNAGKTIKAIFVNKYAGGAKCELTAIQYDTTSATAYFNGAITYQETPRSVLVVWSANDLEYGHADFTVVDSALSTTSTNPVQNKIINAAINGKADKANPEFTGSISMGRKAETTVGTNSIAIGNKAEATGNRTVSIGLKTTASNTGAIAIGNYTVSAGYASVAEGSGTIANGSYTHAAGSFNVADAIYPMWDSTVSYAIGDRVTSTDGSRGICFECIEATNPGDNPDYGDGRSKWKMLAFDSNAALMIGNGTNEQARSNAMKVDFDGNERLAGDVYVHCNPDSTGGYKLISSADVATTAETQAIITEYGVSA